MLPEGRWSAEARLLVRQVVRILRPAGTDWVLPRSPASGAAYTGSRDELVGVDSCRQSDMQECNSVIHEE